MTVKEAMTKVSEEREAFPLGWNTELKEVYAKCGKALYERKQKTVYLMRVLCWIQHNTLYVGLKNMLCRPSTTQYLLLAEGFCTT